MYISIKDIDIETLCFDKFEKRIFMNAFNSAVEDGKKTFSYYVNFPRFAKMEDDPRIQQISEDIKNISDQIKDVEFKRAPLLLRMIGHDKFKITLK